MIPKFTIGDINLFRIVEMEGPILGTFELFPDATPEIINTNKHWMVPRYYEPNSELLIIAIQGFLIKTTKHLILVDTCSGSLKNRKRLIFNQQRWPWLELLSATGALPDDIDIVINTHLNVDHVGWNTIFRNGRWVPTFPNAKYLISKKEFQYWQQSLKQSHLPHSCDYFEDSVLPVFEAGNVLLLDDDQYFIEDGVWLEPIPGHTPGQLAVHIKSNDNEAVIAGDLLHHPLQCLNPDWSTNFCVDPNKARETRRGFIERYAETKTLCFLPHFASPTAGFFKRDGNRFNFQFHGEKTMVIY